uniref:RL-QN15 n=1 Tax=Fejervarya limnocharis TaxID=110108 RepID=A0A7D5UPA0_FEJLI|nr:RL-QN15 [Fejervarya limnocharis]
MFTLKKSLSLVFFLGMVSLSFCKAERSKTDVEPRDGPPEEENTNENEENGEEVEKRQKSYADLWCQFHYMC